MLTNTAKQFLVFTIRGLQLRFLYAEQHDRYLTHYVVQQLLIVDLVLLKELLPTGIVSQ